MRRESGFFNQSDREEERHVRCAGHKLERK